MARPVVVAAHRLGKRRAHFRVAAFGPQPRHDPEDGIPPLAQRDKVVECFEDDVLVAEMLAVPGVLEPIVDEGLFGIAHPSVSDILDSFVDPLLEEVELLADLPVILVNDLLLRIPVCEHGVEALADLANFGRNCLAGNADVQIPIEVEVVVEIVSHQQLSTNCRSRS